MLRPFEIQPEDASGGLYLREVVADGEFAGVTFSVSQPLGSLAYLVEIDTDPKQQIMLSFGKAIKDLIEAVVNDAAGN